MFPCRDYSIFRCVADREPVATGGPSLQGVRRSATDIHNSREKKSGARESSECTVNSLSTATRPFCCVAERRNPLQVTVEPTATCHLRCVAERRNPLLFPRSAAARGIHADGRADEAAGRAGREHVRLLLAADLTPFAVGLANEELQRLVASLCAERNRTVCHGN